jgi:hypothetical protein
MVRSPEIRAIGVLRGRADRPLMNATFAICTDQAPRYRGSGLDIDACPWPRCAGPTPLPLMWLDVKRRRQSKLPTIAVSVANLARTPKRNEPELTNKELEKMLSALKS